MQLLRYNLRNSISLTICLLVPAACGLNTSDDPTILDSRDRDSPSVSGIPPTKVQIAEENGGENRSADTQLIGDESTGVSSLPNLFDMSLTDVASGKSFKLSDSIGTVQIIETMAVWCTRCNRQQKEMVKALREVDNNVVFISIDVDPNENEEVLRRYVETNDFDWPFAISGSEFSKELSLLTSKIVLDPTATPIVIIDPNGDLHILAGNIKPSATLVAEISKYSR